MEGLIVESADLSIMKIRATPLVGIARMDNIIVQSTRVVSMQNRRDLHANVIKERDQNNNLINLKGFIMNYRL